MALGPSGFFPEVWQVRNWRVSLPFGLAAKLDEPRMPQHLRFSKCLPVSRGRDVAPFSAEDEGLTVCLPH